MRDRYGSGLDHASLRVSILAGGRLVPMRRRRRTGGGAGGGGGGVPLGLLGVVVNVWPEERREREGEGEREDEQQTIDNISQQSARI